MPVSSSTEHWIKPDALTINLNHFGDPDYLQVSVLAGAVVMAFKQDVIGYNAAHNYRTWPLDAANTYLETTSAYNVYARLTRSEVNARALVVYDTVLRDIEGREITYAEDGSEVLGDANPDYFFVFLGQISASVNENGGITSRKWLAEFRFGSLNTNQNQNESITGEWAKMFRLNKVTDLIDVLKTISSAVINKLTVAKELVLFGKPVTDIKRSTDEEFSTNDTTIPTTQYLENNFLSKNKDDSTPYSISIGKNLNVGQDATIKGNISSEEFISGLVGGKGWSIRNREYTNAAGAVERKSTAEFDEVIVRGVMRIYELIVSQMLGENDNRIFTGMMEVDHYDASNGKVYLKTNGGRLYNPFRVDDVIIVQQYGGNPNEANGYNVTKQYEFVVTGAGIGEQTTDEERLDWVTFRGFTTPIEGGNESLIAEHDTLVRLDNLSDASRKGVIQLMSVGEDTPYMDFVYGAKTDPDNALKGRFGNLGGVYNPLFGWLKEFGAYLTNLYAVGEFVIAHTGEDVADAIEIAKGSFRTNYRQTTYDMTEEDNFFTNASMTNNCEHWVLGEETTSYFLVDELPQFFNYELYGSEDSFAGIAEYNGRDMLRLSSSTILQLNEKIDKPSTHKEFTSVTENEDGTYTDVYDNVTDKLYLSVRAYCKKSGKLEFGFTDANGAFYDNVFHVSQDLTEQEDAYLINVSGVWTGVGNFCIKSSGDIYIDVLSLTDRPLDNFKIETSTKIEQDATKISLLGEKINGTNGTVTNLSLQVNALDEQITSTVKTVDTINNTIKTAGWINKADAVEVFAEQVDEQGIAKRADLDVYVKFNPTTKKVVSGILLSADQIDLTANDYINIINEGTTTIKAKLIDINGVATINESFKIDEDGTTYIGGFKVSGNDLTNEGFNNDATVVFRNDNYKTFAAIGGNVLPPSAGMRFVARFENEDDSDDLGIIENSVMLVSAKNSKRANTAINIGGGCVSGLAYKTMKIGYDYVESSERPELYSATILREVGCIYANNYFYWRKSSSDNYAMASRKIELTLPTMYPYDDGHTIKVKPYGNSTVSIKASTCYYYDTSGTLVSGSTCIIDGGSAYTGLELDSGSDAIELVYFKDIVRVSGSTTYYGAWVKY